MFHYRDIPDDVGIDRFTKSRPGTDPRHKTACPLMILLIPDVSVGCGGIRPTVDIPLET